MHSEVDAEVQDMCKLLSLKRDELRNPVTLGSKVVHYLQRVALILALHLCCPVEVNTFRIANLRKGRGSEGALGIVPPN